MNIFLAVVEDREDPLHLGRCRIRIFGKHTDDKSMLPTSDLPWAMPMQSITSAASSGVGMAPVGIANGTWVVGFYLDGEDEQQAMMIGTVGSSAAAAIPTSIPSKSTSTAPATVPPPVLTATDGSVVKDGSGSPIRTESIPQPTGWVLGQTSKKYESGGKGPGVINAYAKSGDLGGASYGVYQFASYLPPLLPSGKARPSPKNSALLKYCSASKFAASFAGLDPATPAFDAAWKDCATKFTKEFEDDQHQYIADNFYKVTLGRLKQAGLDLTPFGAGVQDLIWSTSVQMGPGHTKVFLTPLKGMTNLDDLTIINTVCDYKIANVDNLFVRSSQNIKEGVRKRYISEKADLLALAGGYKADVKKPITPEAKVVVVKEKDATLEAPPKSESMPYSPADDKTNSASITSTSTGYSDPDAQYPRKTYSKHSDINKMASGKIDGTAAEAKTNRRAIGMALPDGRSFDQPMNTFHAKYPFNKVYESESGHVVEVDDTPGAERINIWHKSGTFMEIDSVGNMVRRSSASLYEIVDRNGYLYVQGQCNISVGGTCNLMVSADANIEVTGDANITVGNDVTLEAAGRLSMSAGEAIDLRSPKIYIEADEELHLTSGTKMNAQAPLINIKGDDQIKVQTNLLDVKVDGAMHLQPKSLDVHVDGNMVVNTGGKSDFKAAGDITLDAAAKLSLRAAGDVRMDGTSFDWNSGGSSTGGTAIDAAETEDAAYGEAGLIEERKPYEEKIITELAPNTRFDSLAIQCETPEECTVGSAAVEKKLIEQGVVTESEIKKIPAFSAPADTSSVLTVPKISVPGDILSALTSPKIAKLATGALDRVAKSKLSGPELAIVQKLLHSGLDTKKLSSTGLTKFSGSNSISTNGAGINIKVGGISINSSTSIPGLTTQLLKKVRNMKLSPAEANILNAVDLVNIRNMDLSSPAGVMKTLKGMTADLMKFGIHNPEFNKIAGIVKKLPNIPSTYRFTPNFAVKDLTHGATVTSDRIQAQCGLSESEIAANLFGLAHSVLEPIKKAYPNMQVMSAFRRVPDPNTKGPHYTGTAADIRLVGATRDEMFAFAQAVRGMVPFDQLGLQSTSYNESDWVHISFNSEGENRGEVYTVHNHKKIGDGLIKLI